MNCQPIFCDLFARIFPVNFAQNETHKMAKTFILHDESVNTYGYRMLTAGANLTEFRKNPVMFLNHMDFELPIGRWENIRVEDGRILADAVFDDNDERARQVRDKIEDGFIRAASIGAWPPEELSDDEALKLPGQTGPTITKWTMREASIVTIGANHNALVLYDRTTGDRIDLEKTDAFIRLMDTTNTDTNMLQKIRGILQLQDAAADAEVLEAVQTLRDEKERIEGENRALKAAEAARLADVKKAQQTEAEALVDAAVRDGRINAAGRTKLLKLFDNDFEGAKVVLAAIPKRQSVAEQIEKNETAALKDFSGTWDELDRAGKLPELKDKAPAIFKEKFKEHFGVDYKE